MTYEKWLTQFKPRKNEIESNASFDGLMFETFGAELEEVKKAYAENPKRIWTLVDCEGKTRIFPGYHYVNRLGYFITEIPFTTDEEKKLERGVVI